MLEDRIYTLSEFLAILPRPSTIKKHRFEIELLQGGGYFIEWDRINTHEKLIHWVHHLVGKNWVTTETIEDLINAVDRKFSLGIAKGPRGA